MWERRVVIKGFVLCRSWALDPKKNVDLATSFSAEKLIVEFSSKTYNAVHCFEIGEYFRKHLSIKRNKLSAKQCQKIIASCPQQMKILVGPYGKQQLIPEEMTKWLNRVTAK